jgi:hypothetical protein
MSQHSTHIIHIHNIKCIMQFMRHMEVHIGESHRKYDKYHPSVSHSPYHSHPHVSHTHLSSTKIYKKIFETVSFKDTVDPSLSSLAKCIS